MRRAFYILALTPHQREALLTVIGGYIRGDTPAEVSIDLTTGEEIRIEDLLALVLDLLLDCMSPRERDVMIRQGHGMSDAQIAADLRIKVGAVRVARLRARERATEALKDIVPTLDETIQRRFRKLLN